MKKYYLPISTLIVVPNIASAHCPLCTAGAGALAILAASLGVSSIVVGVLIGAFALALSLWIARMVKKQYVPYQKEIIATAIFLGTVLPITPFVQDYGPLYLPFIGLYGVTYTIHLYLVGVVFGAFIMFVSPFVSKVLTKVRGVQFPFQGLTITLTLLVLLSLLIQLLS